MTSQTVNGRVETYRYDDAGNLLQDANNTYEYDAFRRTSKVTTKAGDVQINRYDAEGLRYEMEENGKLVQFIFNENKEVITEETDGNITRLIRTSDLWARESEPEKTWYHYASDEQGSTIFITGKNGEVKNRYTYDAFGNNVEKAEQIPNRYQYTGQQLDPITQQYYLRARYYNPAIARFTQEDEYHGDGLNLYAYCANNPVEYYDPSGYCSNEGKKSPWSSLSKEEEDRILSIPHGQRPDPSEYLTQEQITKHLDKFREGASFVMTKTAYDAFVKNATKIGRPDGLFIMPKTECDRIAIKAKDDLSVYENELGFPAGSLSGDGMVRFDINDYETLEQLNLRMASGNEGGANHMWLPG
nr:RHS repeat-associated core domain-containing protein [Selenomonas caprae]